MKRLLSNKKIIETIIGIILILGLIVICIIFLYGISQNEPTGKSNIQCYWTTKGIICGGKIGK